METKRALENSKHYLMDTYKRFPAVMTKGRGAKVWSSDNVEYLDFVCGVATNVLGHCYPKVVVALQKQAQRLMHVSNLYHIEPQIKLARILVEHSFADKAFFCNSGTEAVEGAIKLARKYSIAKGKPDRFEIIAAENSFHGRTMGALTATGQDKMKAGFGPLVPGFKHVPYNDAEAIKNAITQNTCAVLLEPIQGEYGVRVPAEDYLRKVRAICSDNGLLLILDEVQTGIGRTGKLFGYEHTGITPDIMALAKGLGGGMPIGAVLATAEVAAAFSPGDHGSTFGGNPLACAAGVATLEAILENGLILDQCMRMGMYLKMKLDGLKTKYPTLVKEIRGKGLLVAMELTVECADVAAAAFEKGLMINCTAGSTLRFMPPLIVQENEIDQAISVLDDIFKSRH